MATPLDLDALASTRSPATVAVRTWWRSTSMRSPARGGGADLVVAGVVVVAEFVALDLDALAAVAARNWWRSTSMPREIYVIIIEYTQNLGDALAGGLSSDAEVLDFSRLGRPHDLPAVSVSDPSGKFAEHDVEGARRAASTGTAEMQNMLTAIEESTRATEKASRASSSLHKGVRCGERRRSGTTLFLVAVGPARRAF